MLKAAVKYYRPIASNGWVTSSRVWWGDLILHDRDEELWRKKKLNFHIEAGDYFGTLATVLDLLQQEKEKVEERQNKILKKLRDDLVYLQKHYKIVRKNRRV